MAITIPGLLSLYRFTSALSVLMYDVGFCMKVWSILEVLERC